MYVVQYRIWYMDNEERWMACGTYKELANARAAADRLLGYYTAIDVRILTVTWTSTGGDTG